MSAESTVQIRVGPGEQTQLYYITIANLPFGTGWQQLKDWIRCACEVDHIEVFPKSTSAWVRLRGEENFNKAWKLINGGNFNGRALIADDKNRTQSITIKENVHSPQRHYSETPNGQYCLGNHYAQAYAASYAGQSSTTQRYTYQPPMTTTASRPATYAIAVPREYYTFGDYSGEATPVGQSRATHTAQSQSGELQYPLPYRDTSHDSHNIVSGATESMASQHGASQSNYIATEPRKVFVTGLSQQGEHDEVKHWIRRRAGLANKIISIEIPMNGSSNYLRGHAFVIFETIEGAVKGIDLLSKSKFNSRRVTARLTSEGVAPGECGTEAHKVKSSKSRRPEPAHCQDEPIAGPSRLTDDQLYGGGRSHHPKNRDLKGKSQESDKKRSSDKKPEKKSEKKSDKSSSSSSSKKRSSSDKKRDIGHEAPIVVNGSSSRKKDRR